MMKVYNVTVIFSDGTALGRDFMAESLPALLAQVSDDMIQMNLPEPQAMQVTFLHNLVSVN